MLEKFCKLQSQLLKLGLVKCDSTERRDNFFRFSEICERSHRRYDIRVDHSAEPFCKIVKLLAPPSKIDFDANEEQKKVNGISNNALQSLCQDILGSNYKLLYMGVVWSQPGSEGLFITLIYLS